MANDRENKEEEVFSKGSAGQIINDFKPEKLGEFLERFDDEYRLKYENVYKGHRDRILNLIIDPSRTLPSEHVRIISDFLSEVIKVNPKATKPEEAWIKIDNTAKLALVAFINSSK